MHQLGEGVFALLPAGAENAGQYLMRAGTVGRTIASPGFASHRHQPDGPLGEVIGGMQARTAQKREQMGLLMAQVFGQSLVVRAAKVSIQQAIQVDFQAPSGHRQAMRGNLALLVAISQSEALLQQCFNRQGELGGCGGGHLDHLATAPDQVLQAALMKRLCKPIETSRSVIHQKTGVVRAQNRRRLRIPTMRLNHINSDLFAQQDPQILRACSYSPAGVVQPYHGALPQLTLQLLGRWGPPDSPIAPRPGTPRSGSTSARSPVPAPAPSSTRLLVLLVPRPRGANRRSARDVGPALAVRSKHLHHAPYYNTLLIAYRSEEHTSELQSPCNL